MKSHILHNGLHWSAFRRIGDRVNHFIDGEHFMGRSPLDEPWMTRPSRPPANITKKEKHYDLKVALPGFQKEEISLAVQGRTLTVTAQKDRAIHGHGVVQQEFAGQTLHRTFHLPKSVNTDDIQASLRQGILHIQLSYEPSVDPSTIAVR